MAVVVVEALAQAASGAVTVTNTPQPGDVLIYAFSSFRGSGARNVTAVTGCGATWAPLYAPSGGRVQWWIGTGANVAGVVNSTLDGGSASPACAAWLIRGLGSTTVQHAATTGNDPVAALVGPSQTAEPGQIALAFGRGPTNPITFPSAQAPATGWTQNAATAGSSRALYRIPAASATHRLDATSGTSGLMAIGQLVLGPTPPPGPPTGLAVTSLGTTTATVEWVAPSGGTAATGYDVRTGTDPGVAVGDVLTHTFTDLAPGATYTLGVRATAASGASAWVEVEITTATPADPIPGRPGIASQTLLSLAGLDPSPTGPDAPAQQWWDVDAADAATYSAVRSEGLFSYAIGYAAREPLGKPQPLSIGVVLLVPIGDAVAIGDRFRLRLSETLAEALELDLDAAIRATCIVTDVVSDPTRTWELPGHGTATLWNVTATGWLSRYGAARIDGTTWPTEPVGARIGRVLDSLGLAGDVDGLGPDVLPPGTAGSHHEALAPAVDSTLGRLVEQRDGLVDYSDPEDRRGRTPVLTLDAAEILGDNFSWRQSVSDVVNEADVTYGAETGAKVNVRDPGSADPRTGVGPYPAQISTALTDELDAYNLGNEIVGRRAWPYYQLPAVQIDLARSGLDLDRLAAAFAILNGDRVALTSMPAGSPWDTLPRGCFIEGYTETATAYAWRLSLVVSDPALSGVDLRYHDVPDSTDYQWHDLDPDLTWLDAARIEDPTDLL